MFTGSIVSVAASFSHGRVHLPGWRVSRSSRGGTPVNRTAEAAPCSSTHFLITDRASCLCTSWTRGFSLLCILFWNVTVTVTACYCYSLIHTLRFPKYLGAFCWNLWMLGEILNVQSGVSVQRIRSECQGDVTFSETQRNCTMNQSLNLDLKRILFSSLNIKTIVIVCMYMYI